MADARGACRGRGRGPVRERDLLNVDFPAFAELDQAGGASGPARGEHYREPAQLAYQDAGAAAVPLALSR